MKLKSHKKLYIYSNTLTLYGTNIIKFTKIFPSKFCKWNFVKNLLHLYSVLHDIYYMELKAQCLSLCIICIYCILGKFGKSSLICQTKTIEISTYNYNLLSIYSPNFFCQMLNLPNILPAKLPAIWYLPLYYTTVEVVYKVIFHVHHIIHVEHYLEFIVHIW